MSEESQVGADEGTPMTPSCRSASSPSALTLTHGTRGIGRGTRSRVGRAQEGRGRNTSRVAERAPGDGRSAVAGTREREGGSEREREASRTRFARIASTCLAARRGRDRLIGRHAQLIDSSQYCGPRAALHSGLRIQKNARNAGFTRISHKKQLYTDISLCCDLLLKKPLPSKGPHGFMNVFWLLFYRVVANWKSLAFYYVLK